MTEQHEAAKHLGDLAASGGGLFVMVSHFAELATPIITLIIGVVTLVWWGLRFYDRFRKRI